MANLRAFFITLAISLIALNLTFVDAKFSKSVYITWGADPTWINSDNLQLELTNLSGSGIASKRAFLFGSIEMLIKLVPGNSAGTVTAYYLSSTGSTHDEIDFEFLGNISGQPYTIHTNVYTQGIGGKEQQFRPWFDPTSDFHNYTIHWNPSHIVWFVDGFPIRVFKNYESNSITFPNLQGMKAYASLWNATWATQGGRIQTNWNNAPFIARFRRFRPRACRWIGPVSISQCATNTTANWWTSPVYSELNQSQIRQMMLIRNNSMIYNYCTDYRRFKWTMPAECSLPQY